MSEFLEHVDKKLKTGDIHPEIARIWKREKEGLKSNRAKIQRVVEYPLDDKRYRREGDKSLKYRKLKDPVYQFEDLVSIVPHNVGRNRDLVN